MASIILRRLAENLTNYKVINRIEFLGTKVRAYMPEEYTLIFSITKLQANTAIQSSKEVKEF